MTTRQITISMFIFTLAIGGAFLAMLIKIDYSLAQTDQAIKNLQHQIDDIKAQDRVTTEQILKLTQINNALAKNVEITQDLQRKQAIVVGELRKGRRK